MTPDEIKEHLKRWAEGDDKFGRVRRGDDAPMIKDLCTEVLNLLDPPEAAGEGAP